MYLTGRRKRTVLLDWGRGEGRKGEEGNTKRGLKRKVGRGGELG